jgi:predicted acylesterase/phospholipase RssA
MPAESPNRTRRRGLARARRGRYILSALLALAADQTVSAAQSFSQSLGGSSRGPSPGSSVPSAENSVKFSNRSLYYSAEAEVLASAGLSLRNGASWSEAFQHLGPVSQTSAKVALAFLLAPTGAVEPETLRSIRDIRSALGAGPYNDARKCDNILLKSSELSLIARRALLRVDDGDTPRSLVDFLRLTDRLAQRPENAKLLDKLYRSQFRCKDPDPDEKLRAAALIAFWKASAIDWEDGRARSRTPAPKMPAAPIWEAERRRAMGMPPDPAAQPPALCLAMSGGGTRSAAFQLGALQGLSELGLLDQVDVASAVSGGSYTLAWLVARTDSRETLRSERALHKLDRRASWLTSKIEGVAGGVSTIGTWLLPLFSRSLLQTSIPDATYAHFHYAQELAHAYYLEDRPLSSLVSPLRPFPIFVATARAGEEGTCAAGAPPEIPFRGAAANVQRSVFELTPFGGGSEQLGFSRRLAGDMAMTMAIATSGAALDDPYRGYCRLLRDFGLTLGIRLGVWHPDLAGASPAPAGQLPEPLNLSDGGFADNLGIYPLVRRGCQRILVIDATWDPHLTFDEYQRFDAALGSQRGASLESSLMDVARAHGERCEKTPDGKVPDPDCLSHFVYAKRADGQSGSCAARTADNAVFTGILHLPGGKTAPFQYVKLAVDEKRLDQYPRPVQDAIRRDADKARNRDARERLFPHIPTTNQKLNPSDFQGLRLLGCYLVEKSFAAERQPPSDSPCQRH